MMKTEIKTILVKQMDDAGTGLARIANLAAVDHDGDTYIAGAFGEQWVPILPAHDRSKMPLGKARVFEKDGEALADLRLNLDTVAGRDWHATLKFDLATGRPAQEWSYGFGVLDAAFEQRGDDRIRVLKRLDVHEVSPVIRGAGAGTATLSMKSRGSFVDQIDAVIGEIDDIIGRAGDIANMREAEGRAMSKARVDQLTALKAKLDALLAPAVVLPPGDQIAERQVAEFVAGAARRRFERR